MVRPRRCLLVTLATDFTPAPKRGFWVLARSASVWTIT